jgi:hypothetical protein
MSRNKGWNRMDGSKEKKPIPRFSSSCRQRSWKKKCMATRKGANSEEPRPEVQAREIMDWTTMSVEGIVLRYSSTEENDVTKSARFPLASGKY